MKFGKVDDPSIIDFTLPTDHLGTEKILLTAKDDNLPEVYVGCAKWNKTDLKGFYPRGTKDELTYYSSQFGCIELNATFYRIFPESTVENWYNKTPQDFKFFPKVPQLISQFRRLKDVDDIVNEYLASIGNLKEKLGMIFLQMPQNFAPKSFDVLEQFVQSWPKDVKLALELRHTDWYANGQTAEQLYHLLEANEISHVITDTAGRRDLMHMRLTSPYAFIRYTGANHETDYTRMDDWLDRFEVWKDQGLKGFYFFVHQNLEVASPLLSSYFIEKLNKRFGYEIKIPTLVQEPKTLF